MGCGASTRAEINAMNMSAGMHGMQSDEGLTMNTEAWTGSLRSFPPYAYGTPVTLRQLEARRAEFWQTRVDGNALMWQAIRSAAEAMLADDIGLATVILEASEIRAPTGYLDICYDERGYQYRVPNFCLANPSDMLTENAMPVDALGLKGAKDEKNRVVISQSKGPPTEISVNITTIPLKVKVNPGDIAMHLHVQSSDTVGGLKHAILTKSIEMGESQIQVCEEGRQRVMFMGRELKEMQNLSDIGVDDQRVIQVFMRPKPSD